MSAIEQQHGAGTTLGAHGPTSPNGVDQLTDFSLVDAALDE